MRDGGEQTRTEDAGARAPTEDAWSKMTAEERQRVALALPAFVPVDIEAPRGDAHRRMKTGAVQALEAFFRRVDRRIYVSSDLAVYYPDEPRIAPDLLVVLDAEPRERATWVVSAEKKGVDLVLEIHAPPGKGSLSEEHERRLARLSSLGVCEYFSLDRERGRLRGYRLAKATSDGEKRRSYEPIAPVEGRLPSTVLGLDLMIQGGRIRFFCGTAMLPEADELIARLGGMVNEAATLREDAERHADREARRAEREAARADEATQRAQESQARAEEEARRAEAVAERADLAERRLAEALSELHKLKGWE